MQLHPIIQQSFSIIDQEIGPHRLTPQEYAIVRRVIHSSADFEFTELLHFSPHAIVDGIAYLQRGHPIVTDVSMVAQGIRTMVAKTFQNPILNALDYGQETVAGATRTETGLLKLWEQVPNALYVIGNAPTALLALCHQIEQRQDPAVKPCLVVGAPVGFVSVIESKEKLAQTAVEQIRVTGRKGGSAIGAAIVNALLHLAWESH